jgi:hypothetical protein
MSTAIPPTATMTVSPNHNGGDVQMNDAGDVDMTEARVVPHPIPQNGGDVDMTEARVVPHLIPQNGGDVDMTDARMVPHAVSQNDGDNDVEMNDVSAKATKGREDVEMEID